MSKKTDIIVVGVLSAALFTGFTAYSYSVDKAKSKAQAKLPAQVTTGVQNASAQPVKLALTGGITASAVQTPADTQPDVTQPAPDTTVTKKKTTKSKAS
jgi:type II secretory pathway pseudopilin PulG